MKTSAIALALVAAVATGAVPAAPRGAPVAEMQEEAKPHGPIAIDVRLAAPPVLGVTLTVSITARAQAIDRLELEVHADDSAALVIGAPSSPVDGAGSRSWVVTVVPMRTSGGNLSVVVSGEIEGVAQAQSVTTKIRPAGILPTVRALSAAPAAPAEAGGENLSLLPVEERF